MKIVDAECIREVAERVSGVLRGRDFAARFGGDEFAILLEDVASETAVSEVVEGLFEVIGASLSRKNLARVGWSPLAQGFRSPKPSPP